MNLSTKDRIKKYRQTKDSRLRHEIIKENMNLTNLILTYAEDEARKGMLCRSF